MSTAAYPYDTRLNILFPHLELIDEKALSDSVRHKWFNQTLCKVNDSVVRVGVVQREYHWHKNSSMWSKANCSSTSKAALSNLAHGRVLSFQKACSIAPARHNERSCLCLKMPGSYLRETNDSRTRV